MKLNDFLPCLKLLIIKLCREMLSRLIHIAFRYHIALKTTRMKSYNDVPKETLKSVKEYSLDIPASVSC